MYKGNLGICISWLLTIDGTHFEVARTRGRKERIDMGQEVAECGPAVASFCYR